MSTAKDPSRRVALYQGESHLGNYQTTCISKHYALNNQILAAFESHYRNELFEIAFYLGLKFVETALIEIPKHGYFLSRKHKKLRVQSSTDALRVTQLLQEIIAEEPEALANECHKVERLNYLANQQLDNPKKYESERLKVEEELYGRSSPAAQKPKKLKSKIVTNVPGDQDCMTATFLACGDSIDSFTSIFCPASSETMAAAKVLQEEFGTSDATKFPEEGKHTEENISSFPNKKDMKQQMDAFPPFDETKIEEEKPSFPPTTQRPKRISSGSVPPPVPLHTSDSSSVFPPPPDHIRTQSDLDLERALFLSGLQFALQGEEKQNDSYLEAVEETREQPPGRPAPPGAKRRSSTNGITMELLTGFFLQDFSEMKTSGRVRISQMSTYQGKTPGSTNGCTVIAPLVCIHHFHNDSVIPDPGLTDNVVEHILDEEVPSLLPQIREDLGLCDNAFLIPVDAHDALMKQQLLAAEQFLDVFGGNVLDGAHLKPLLDKLSVIGDKKIAATFFFHEHVVTILQLRRSTDKVWFDVIDSLPHAETLLKKSESRGSTRSIGDSSRISADDEFRIATGQFAESEVIPGVLIDEVPQEPAFRMRCLDVQALEIALQWYACSVFDEEDTTYIDTYHWDDNLADFDPRVFQSFVWTEA